MATYIHFTEDQKARARQTDIAELLRSQGETLKRSGSEMQWRDGPDKVTIRGNLWYHHYEQTGGDAVDFVKKFYRKSYPEAVTFLLGERGGAALAPPIIRERKPFALPEKNDNMRRVAAYLLEQRGIARSVLAAFVAKGLIYESLPYHNAVFVGMDRDGVPRHAALRGIGSPGYKGNAPGSAPEYSFHWTGQTEPAPNLRTEVQSLHPNVRLRQNQSEKLYLFEAPIDLLSFISMHPENWRRNSYAAACSVSDRVLLQCLKDQPGIREVLLCLDSDGPGQGAAKRIKEKLNKLNIQSEILVPSQKDWNEDLIFRESEVQECLQLQG